MNANGNAIAVRFPDGAKEAARFAQASLAAISRMAARQKGRQKKRAGVGVTVVWEPVVELYVGKRRQKFDCPPGLAEVALRSALREIQSARVDPKLRAATASLGGIRKVYERKTCAQCGRQEKRDRLLIGDEELPAPDPSYVCPDCRTVAANKGGNATAAHVRRELLDGMETNFEFPERKGFQPWRLRRGRRNPVPWWATDDRAFSRFCTALRKDGRGNFDAERAIHLMQVCWRGGETPADVEKGAASSLTAEAVRLLLRRMRRRGNRFFRPV